MTKVIALYLPQYYETDYNNRWWGKGYTEWVALKNAKPLFKGHDQPRVPQNQWYYDLSRKENIQKQFEMAKSYGLDGFAVYQYYSCKSKLLEVPTEMILQNKDLDMPFFLFWANESWRKMWYGQDRSVLWEQKYGDEGDWRKQFEYCLRYFKDPRYILQDNKPVYGIYHAWEFKEADRFVDCWNRWAKEEGFDGIYFIRAANFQDKGRLGSFNAVVAREPNYTLAYDESFLMHVYRYIRTRGLDWINKKLLIPKGKGIVMYRPSYDWVWKKILARDYSDKTTLPGAFTDWDNSPRKAYNAYIMKGASPEKFKNYFTELYRKALKDQSPFILLNAWNEWGEGAYLEPDETNGDAFLKAIQYAKEQKKGEKQPQK